MTQALVTVDSRSPTTWSDNEWGLIKSQIAPDCTDDELVLFGKVCQRTGLDPFIKQIYAIKRGKKMTIQTGIDGYRLLADRTGCYAGSDDAEYDIEDADHPNWAKVTVWKLVQGIRCPYTAKARWSEYHQEFQGKLADMWARFPFLMLGKCAEALALRKAFPAELSGIYTQEEMDQADERDMHPANAPTARQATQAAPRTAAPRQQRRTESTTEPTLDELKMQIADICKAHGFSNEALKAWLSWQKNRYNTSTWNHMDEVLKRLKADPTVLDELSLQNLATKHLLTVENLVAIIRRRSGDMTKNFADCWKAYAENRVDWDGVIDEEVQTLAQKAS